MNQSFEIAPYLPQIYAGVLALLAVLTVALALFKKNGGTAWRAAFFLLMALVLLNPVFIREVKTGLNDKLVVVVDESPSQNIAERNKVTEKALAAVKEQAAKMTGVETVVFRSGADAAGGKQDSTNLFTVLNNNLMGLPLGQIAGTILITDGQVHDVPEELGVLQKAAPFHAILTGRKDEFDRKVTVVSAPKYGLLSDVIKISVKVEDFGRSEGAMAPLTVYQDGQKVNETVMATGQTEEFTFKLKHPGQNVFEFNTPAEKGELTEANNSAPVIINGVRDRLRVLLVSGEPHMGERAWRNLLKSDPSIDLVHFTILRSMTSMDGTPPNEMSLIAFPVEELFQKKINDFDLIVFDRYRQYNLLLPQYFLNIMSFVKNGGGLLLAMGSDQVDTGIFKTSVADVLPVEPIDEATDRVTRKAFLPELTEDGKAHPVTADIQRQFQQRKWGQWLTQAQIDVLHGKTLMNGADGKPLLILDKAVDGRVAVLTSDNIWMWSKGGKTEGPYTELLRNLAHWLMKEPELEEDYIKAEAKGNTITVSARGVDDVEKPTEMTDPSGAKENIKLNEKAGGWTKAHVLANKQGIYSFTRGDKKAFVVVGSASNPEFSDVHTTEEKLASVIKKSGGSFVWYQDHPDFSLRSMSASSSDFGGDSWLGIKRNNAYQVKSVESHPLFSNGLAILITLFGLLFVWWRESRGR